MYPGPWITVVSRILAVLIAAAEPSYWVGHALGGVYSLQHDLPLELSRVAEFVSAAALWWPKPFAGHPRHHSALSRSRLFPVFRGSRRRSVGRGLSGRRPQDLATAWSPSSCLPRSPRAYRLCRRRRCRDESKLYVPAREASRR